MLQAGGIKGGLSRITDEFAPLGKTSNYLPSVLYLELEDL